MAHITLAEALEVDSEAFEKDGIIYHMEETEEPGMCLDCKEHCGVCLHFENGIEVDTSSNCCGSGVHIF